ncbi:MAG: UDP-N-acetylmuramoyl-tripeptide--D-alanyl-D-alanine ligase [Cytophagaceae bacterium]
MYISIEELYQIFKNCTGISTDTRKIERGNMFFALKGPNFNANDYAQDALGKGASYVVVDEERVVKDDRYLLTGNVLEMLQKLANHHRRQFNIPFIAITGSNGKTTTKELVNAVLSAKYKTYATIGNLNNHIGIPITILSIKEDVEIAIIEMGANHQKEIASYCTYTEPTHGMITNIGKAHLEGFGGIEGVKKGKGELYDYLLQSGGTAFICSINETLRNMSKFTNPVWYPSKNDFYHCEFIDADPFVKIKAENGQLIETAIIGAYNFENIAAALCIGKYFDVPPKEANKAIASYVPQNNRSQVVEKGTNKIILDAYNANPSSMKAALQNFAAMEEKNKFVILGDMLELGDETIKEHKEIGRLIKDLRFAKVVFCGPHMKTAAGEIEDAIHKESRKELEEWIRNNKPQNAILLIKGSRGMGLEKILELL